LKYVFFGKIFSCGREEGTKTRYKDSKGRKKAVLVRCNAETVIGKLTLQKSEWDTSLRK
jgi:hypothetical protein